MISFNGNALDELVIHEVLAGKSYPKPPLKPEARVRLVGDIGAHVGSASLWFKQLWPECKLVCWEPCPSSVVYLRQNVPWAEIRPYGLWWDDTTRKLATDGRSVLNTLFSEREGIDVELRKGSELESLKPDVIKLDTEGCEVGIMMTALDAFQKAKVVYVEFHSWQDRVTIDNLLDSTHILFHVRMNNSVHNGELAYVHQDWIDPAALKKHGIMSQEAA